jgi:hypothetical protein
VIGIFREFGFERACIVDEIPFLSIGREAGDFH